MGRSLKPRAGGRLPGKGARRALHLGRRRAKQALGQPLAARGLLLARKAGRQPVLFSNAALCPSTPFTAAITSSRYTPSYNKSAVPVCSAMAHTCGGNSWTNTVFTAMAVTPRRISPSMACQARAGCPFANSSVLSTSSSL